MGRSDARHLALRVKYETKPPVVSLNDERARQDSLKPETSIGREELQVKRGDVDAALASAAHKIDIVYSTPVENHNPIETY